MTRVEQLYERMQRELREANDLLEAYHACEDRGSDEAQEKREAFRRAKEAAEQTKADLREAEAMSQLNDIQLVRTETTPGRTTARPNAPSRGERLAVPDAQQLRDRRMLLDLVMLRNERLDDERLLRATQIFPVERLYLRVLRANVAPGSDRHDDLTNEEREAWKGYVTEHRAITDGLTTGTAGSGSEFVPDFVLAQIFASRLYMGPLAGDGLITIFNQPTFAHLTLPQVTSLDTTDQTAAEGADADAQNVDTGDLTIADTKMVYRTELSYEFFNSDITNFVNWLLVRVGEYFGGNINTRRTTGSGGVVGRANAAAIGYQIPTARISAPNEGDFRGFFSSLPTQYFGRPTTRLMVRGETEFYMSTLRSNGQRIYPLNMATGKLVLPRLIDYELNDALQSLGASGRKVAALGEMARLAGVYFGGRMRNHVEFRATDEVYNLVYAQNVGEAIWDGAGLRQMYCQ